MRGLESSSRTFSSLGFSRFRWFFRLHRSSRGEPQQRTLSKTTCSLLLAASIPTSPPSSSASLTLSAPSLCEPLFYSSFTHKGPAHFPFYSTSSHHCLFNSCHLFSSYSGHTIALKAKTLWVAQKHHICKSRKPNSSCLLFSNSHSSFATSQLPFFFFKAYSFFLCFFFCFSSITCPLPRNWGIRRKKTVQLGSSDSSFNHCHFHNNPCSNCSQQKQKQDEGFSSLLLWSPHRRGSLLSDSRRKFLTSFQLSALNLDVEP